MSAAHTTRHDREAREHAAGRARDALLVAAAAMTDPSAEHKAQAFILAGVAMVRIAESDDGSALDLAIQHLTRMKEVAGG